MDKKDIPLSMTVEKQISNLLKKKLTIHNEDAAKEFLNKVSYYRFIKAYSIGLKTKNGNYNAGVTFEQLQKIYEFNSKLRQILFPVIEYIEISLRCNLANYLCDTYGVLAYKNKNVFENEEYYNSMLADISSELEKNKRNLFIKNFTQNYKGADIPLYALIEIFSFGMLSRCYANLNSGDKKIIALKVCKVGYTYYESWIKNIVHVRNICAHYGRIYNTKLKNAPNLYNEYSSISNYRIFATILCMKHIVKDMSVWNSFKTSLLGLIEEYSEYINMDFIGFPDNWVEVLEQ